MNDGFSIFVLRAGTCVALTEWVGSLELGRQDEGEPEPYRSYECGPGNQCRMVVAPRTELSVSRRQLRLDAAYPEKIRAENISTTRSIELGVGSALSPGELIDLSLPARIWIGDRTLLVEAAHSDVVGGTLTLKGEATTASPPNAVTLSSDIGSETITDWLTSVLSLLRSAATSEEFFEKAARAVVDVGGFDVGAFLRRHEPDWQVVSSHRTEHDATEWRPSRSVLRSLCENKQTLWAQPAFTTPLTETLLGVNLAMAAPILDSTNNLIGALYGERRGDYGFADINRVAATIIDLLAGIIATAIASRKHEEAALSARLRFEEFFTPQLARQLDAQPDLLRDREAQVTVLFVDVRNFSRLAERLDRTTTARWLREILTTLSDCVAENAGVLVDYVGDEILAMWGAPEQQEDHAIRACRTAMAMLDALPQLNRRLRIFVDTEVQLGIGINTGLAIVGQVGSERKFKYGPLGNTVNVGSRVRGVTKYLASDVIVTRATLNQLDSEFTSRRLCRARLANIEEPVEIFELAREGEARLAAIREPYEAALKEFELGHYSKASKKLAKVFIEQPADGPALLLMSRIIRSLTEAPDSVEPVWEVPGK